MSGMGNLYSKAIGQLPPNMQNYIGGASYTGMRQDQNQNPGGRGAPAGQAPFSAGVPPASFGQPLPASGMPSGGVSWPGFGMGGMPGTYGTGFNNPGLAVMPPGGASGQDFLNGFMPNGGMMPYGGGSGMRGGPYQR